MSVRVWSPTAGTPIRLKVEQANDPTKSVETEANTTMASTWEILVFDFSNQAPGTAALNLTYTYNKASIFFNFGTTGAQAGEQTYYWDDMYFGIFTDVNSINLTNNAISVYPNPAEDMLYIASNNTTTDVAIIDVVGNLVKEYKNAGQSINVSDLTTGVYIVRVSNFNGEIVSTRFIKK